MHVSLVLEIGDAADGGVLADGAFGAAGLGAFAAYDKAMIVLKLRGAREHKARYQWAARRRQAAGGVARRKRSL
jgi:hypothetical protein